MDARQAILFKFIDVTGNIATFPAVSDASTSQVIPHHLCQVALTKLSCTSWVERGTARVKCLSQEHNKTTPAWAQTWNSRSNTLTVRPPPYSLYLVLLHVLLIENDQGHKIRVADEVVLRQNNTQLCLILILIIIAILPPTAWLFVRIVSAIVIMITLPVRWDASAVGAPELI